jgi:hypothetical protein
MNFYGNEKLVFQQSIPPSKFPGQSRNGDQLVFNDSPALQTYTVGEKVKALPRNRYQHSSHLSSTIQGSKASVASLYKLNGFQTRDFPLGVLTEASRKSPQPAE